MTTFQTGVTLTAADTGPDGIQATVVLGECFGKRIEWFSNEAAVKTVTVKTDPETGLPMLTFPLGRGLVAEYRGLEPNGITWWRYAHEVDPNEYREHCLRIAGLA